MWVGVDVGLQRLHAVAIDATGDVLWADAFAPDEAVEHLRGAAGVAVDSPGDWSTAPHAGDETVAPKFRLGRCGEIDLGRRYRLWVPWPTPPEPAPGTWMATGIAVFAALRAAGHDPVEAYPYAGFRLLAGERLPKKTTREGRAVRARLLQAEGIDVNVDAALDLHDRDSEALGLRGRERPQRSGDMGLERSHDFLDAALNALVARQRALGEARVATCGHDGSAIWLPAP